MATGRFGAARRAVALERLPPVAPLSFGIAGTIADTAFVGCLVEEILDGHVVVQAGEVFLHTELGTEQGRFVQDALGLQIQFVAGQGAERHH